MVGVVMAASTDYNIYGGVSHNPCQFSTARANASWGLMPTTSPTAFQEKASKCMTPATDAGENSLDNFYIGVGDNISNVEAAQLELADVLRGILDGQEAELANQPDEYCLNSVIKATNSPTNHLCNHSVISVSSAHDTESTTLIDTEGLLVIENPFNLDASTHQSNLSSTSADHCDYSRLACINSSGNSSSNVMHGYNDDKQNQQLEAINVDDSFDDYSLSTINGGAVLGCNELPPTKNMVSSRLETYTVDHGAFPSVVDIGNNNRSDQSMVVISVDHAGENVCMELENPHVLSQHLANGDTAKRVRDNGCHIDGDADKHIRNGGCRPVGVASCTPEYGMISICNEEPLYPSSRDMKLMKRQAAYAAAAMQPVDWAAVAAVNAGARPKRRNVRISQDPQTVSARRRRERISDRIRVLQRMVPGGAKLDTASMLDEAIHYLKYLKSQVQALEWLDQRRESPSAANHSSLASSPSSFCLYPNYIQPSCSRLMIIK